MNEREDNKAEERKNFKKLMKEIRCNPEKGLKRFYGIYQKIIQSTAQLVCRCVHTANEVVNDVLVKIWKLASTVDDIQNPSGWVYTITLNTAKNTFRTRRELPLDENVAASESNIQRMIDEDAFYWYLQGLAEEEQIILARKIIGRYTFQEIADDLGKPLPSITSTFYRSLDKIKAKLEKSEKK